MIWEWFYKSPIIEVKLFKNLQFSRCERMMFILGLMYFASLVMMPLFLQSLMGYTAESAGLVLSGGGVLLLLADAGCGRSFIEGAGALPDSVRLARAGDRHVCIPVSVWIWT